MARGQTPFDIPVPLSGWRTDLPRHRLPPDALQDGLNCLVVRDGLLKPRRGYQPLPEQPGTPGQPGSWLSGGVAWTDDVGQQQLVVASLTAWYALGDGLWTPITDAPLSGDITEPARLVQFGSLNGQASIYGVNGSAHDLMRRWSPALPHTQVVVDTVNGDFSFAAADVAVVANRLVAIATTENGATFPKRVRWSAVIDGGSYPPLAFNDLEGPTGNLIAIHVTSRTSAIIYAESGAWIMTALPGDDAGAFAFDLVVGAATGPVSPSAVCGVGTVHYYLSADGHIWKCDGYYAGPISLPIDGGLEQLASGDRQIVSTLYDNTGQFVWFFCVFEDDLAPFHAIVYDLLTGIFEVPQQFHDAITMAVEVTEQFGPTWDNPAPFTDWDSGDVAWNDLAESTAPALYVGTSGGLMFRFLSGGSDNGAPIPYQSIWPLMAAPAATQRLQDNALELYLEAASSPTTELVTVMLQAFSTPYDPAPRAVLLPGQQQIGQNPADVGQWLIRLDPTVATSAYQNANYMQVSIQGDTTETLPVVAGGTAYGSITERPDIQSGISQNTGQGT